MFDILIFAASTSREFVKLASEQRRDGGIPRDANALTPQWLTAALQQSFPGVRVQAFDGLTRHSGTTDRASLRLKYGEGLSGPDTLFVKTAPPDMMTRVFINLLRLGTHEVRFYRDIAPQLDIEVPKAYFADVHGKAQRFAIVLEDLVARGATLYRVADLLEVEDAKRTMKTFARLHARFVDSPLFHGPLSWLRTPGRVDRVTAGSERSLPKLAMSTTLRKHGGLVPLSVRNAAASIVRSRSKLERAWGQGPLTLLHGDAHSGNLYRIGDSIGCLDWQLVQRGQGMRDVSYFLTTSLGLEVRRAHERELIEVYLDAFEREGGAPPSFRVAWEQYRLHALYSWQAAMFTAAASSLQDAANALRGLERTSTALVDLESIEALRAFRL